MLPFTLLALFAAPLAVQAFEVVTPTAWLANTTVTCNWTSVTTDPERFSIELYNPALLPTGPIGIADTVDAFLFTVNIPLPRVTPGDGYSFAFVNVGNINQVYVRSGFFPILQNDVSSNSTQTATTAGTTSHSRSQGTTSTSTTNGTTTTAAVPATAKVPTATGTTPVAQPSQFGAGAGFASFSSPSEWTLIAAVGALAFASL